MSRSYKHFPISRMALWEFKFLETKQDAINDWEESQARLANGVQSWKTLRDWSLEDAINDWAKFHKRK